MFCMVLQMVWQMVIAMPEVTSHLPYEWLCPKSAALVHPGSQWLGLQGPFGTPTAAN